MTQLSLPHVASQKMNKKKKTKLKILQIKNLLIGYASIFYCEACAL